MERGTIEKIILSIHEDNPIKWKQVIDSGIRFEAEDIISAGYEEPYYSENNSHDGYYYLTAVRKIVETDEEFEKRKRAVERQEKWSKDRRRQSYLLLKKEFENEGI